MSLASNATADTLRILHAFAWPHDGIVGLSGLEMSEDGSAFTTISDRGWIITGTIMRQAGEMTEVTVEQHLPLLGNDGLPVAARRVGDWSDAEGLAVHADGRFWVAYERWARVAEHPGPTQASKWIRDHPTFAQFSDNRQLEALALHPNGDLFAFSEEPLADGFPIYRLRDGTWGIDGTITQSDSYAIVGADFDHDGALYLLERKLVLGVWWQSRVRRIADMAAPDQIETLWESQRGAYDNLEGLSVWYDDDGLRVTMVTDNNSDVDEPTTFVEARLEVDP